MANPKEEPVELLPDEEPTEHQAVQPDEELEDEGPIPAVPPGYESRPRHYNRRNWPWPPLSQPRRSPRGHPPPKPYIRRPRYKIIKEEGTD